MMSAAQQSPGGRTVALKHCVKLGPLEQPLFGNRGVSQIHTLYNKLQDDDICCLGL